ncbi:hypothetical protein EYF80_046465 [Liparis tanakae]|uniref:Uncharacterized protein n=1 Tax=Liparis tanakae TaxID=230148 RepID=A0A4Z2FQB1_9TELE|nr:hypothetical protein EYF80_046465 [Liparis tanakae]
MAWLYYVPLAKTHEEAAPGGEHVVRVQRSGSTREPQRRAPGETRAGPVREKARAPPSRPAHYYTHRCDSAHRRGGDFVSAHKRVRRVVRAHAGRATAARTHTHTHTEMGRGGSAQPDRSRREASRHICMFSHCCINYGWNTGGVSLI